jgi:phospholipid/cholesterol/gamma-HCH transport system permease protein
MIRELGSFSLGVIHSTGAAATFAGRSLCAAFYPLSIRKLLLYIYEMGVRTTPLVLLVGFFTGMVLGLQGYYTLVKFGSEGLLGSAVALTIVREIGPVLTAVMVVGQAGSSMAAEIGVQRNSEQIDALKIMGINPLAFLIGPRLLAALIVFPSLTAFFDLIGMWGGFVSGSGVLGVDEGIYWGNLMLSLKPVDVIGGLVKSVVFGFITILVCCFEGYYTHVRSTLPGARGVSASATRAVVISSVLILVSDYLITAFIL